MIAWSDDNASPAVPGGAALGQRRELSTMCADVMSPTDRSRLMSRIRGRDTGPERAVRRLLTDLGYRYRLQYKRLPGRPDIAFPGRRKAIWVHGCFWHQHPGCPKATLPKSRPEFWIPKLDGNRRRDRAVQAEAAKLGWDTLVVWECELRDPGSVAERLAQFVTGADTSPPATQDGLGGTLGPVRAQIDA